MAVAIRPAMPGDFDPIWAVLEPVIRAGEHYALPRDMDRDAARAYWMTSHRATYVITLDGQVVGSYYIRANQQGGGAHVCNCGYLVDPQVRGQGLAAQMCLHSQDMARAFGFLAMQFNFVLASNTRAIALWERLGFATVGRLPRAFDHPRDGLIDALVMYKWLAPA
jgi:RimJ/RimL family protein N-acetyltransferase